MKRMLIINVNLEYELPDNVKTASDLEDYYMDIELPKEYVEDSFEFQKVINDDTFETINF